MAEDAVDQAQTMASLEKRRCTTAHLQIHGSTKQAIDSPFLSVYGTDAPAVQELATREPALAEKIHPELPYIKAEVVWAAREEMARTIEDVLSRRTRGLLLGARASIEAAAVVADLLARELGRDEAWKKQAVADYQGRRSGLSLTGRGAGLNLRVSHAPAGGCSQELPPPSNEAPVPPDARCCDTMMSQPSADPLPILSHATPAPPASTRTDHLRWRRHGAEY